MLMDPREDRRKVYPDKTLTMESRVTLFDHCFMLTKMQVAWFVKRDRCFVGIDAEDAFTVSVHELVLCFSIVLDLHPLLV
jgi:hypothetical protein